jgi:hypothetical protein
MAVDGSGLNGEVDPARRSDHSAVLCHESPRRRADRV